MQEAQVLSLGWEKPLKEGMATHSGILAWRILWTEEPGGLYSPEGHEELDPTERLSTHTCTWLWLFIIQGTELSEDRELHLHLKVSSCFKMSFYEFCMDF